MTDMFNKLKPKDKYFKTILIILNVLKKDTNEQSCR